jgi:hypothetical protein
MFGWYQQLTFRDFFLPRIIGSFFVTEEGDYLISEDDKFFILE